MKRPTWATVAGVLGIIFACLGILGAGQDILMPKIFKFQKEMVADVEKIMEEAIEKERKHPSRQAGENNSDGEIPKGMFKAITKMMDFPDWFGTWTIISGILKLMVCAVFLLASIGLLKMKLSSIKLFYFAAGSSIALGALKAMVALSAMSFMAIAVMFGGLFGIVIDIVLIIVVAMGNKEAFYGQSPPPLPQSLLV